MMLLHCLEGAQDVGFGFGLFFLNDPDREVETQNLVTSLSRDVSNAGN